MKLDATDIALIRELNILVTAALAALEVKIDAIKAKTDTLP
jgi:hypothetical protein